MKRLLPILLCFLAFAVPRLYGQKTYPVTFSATEGGTLTAQALNPWVEFQSGDDLAAGTNLNFNASANEGYQLEYWEINDERSDLTDYSISLDNLQAPLKVVAHFKVAPADGYAVHFSAVGEGEIKASYRGESYWDEKTVKDGDKVPAGKVVTFTATPKEGKDVGHWTINGKQHTESYGEKEITYTVIAETTLSVEFIDPVYDLLTFEATEGAKVTARAGYYDEYKSGSKVKRGTKVTFESEFKPDYKLDYWDVNGTRYTSNSIEYQVMGDTHVKLVARQKDKFPVNFSAEANGEVAAFRQIKDENYNISFSEITSGETIAEESQLVLLAKPSEGYHLVGWTLAGDTISKESTFPYKVKNGDNTIVAHFATGADTESVLVHFSASEGGKLTAQASIFNPSYMQIPVKEGFPVKADTRVSFTAIPDSLYMVKSWSVNGKSEDSYKGKKEFSHNFNAADTVRVEFERFTPRFVTFEASPAEGGSVEVRDFNYENVKSGYPVPEGSKISVSADKKEGYVFDYWEINGQRSNHYTVSKISDYPVWDNVSFKAYFRKLVKLPVTFSSTGDGTVEGVAGSYWGDKISSGDLIQEGVTIYFTATPNTDAKLLNWTINGVDTLTGETSISYEVQKDKANTIVAKFSSTAVPTAVVTFTYDGEGGLACTDKLDDAIIASNQAVPVGKVLQFVATPATGYSLTGWTINGEELYPNQTTIEYTVVEGGNNITAHFKKLYQLTLTPTIGGSLVAKVGDKEVKSGEMVLEGTTVSIEATPETGYELTALTAGTEDILATKSFVMNGATEVKATFTKLQKNYVVTLKSNEHGTISIKEQVDLNAVPEGTKLTVVAKGANDKCELTKLTANGKDILKDKTFTVAKDTEVIAEFVDHTGIDAVAADAFVIYPNPANESATVTGLAPEAAVALYTLDGQLITRLAADRSGRLQIDLTALSDGTYLVVTEEAAQRLVVKH